MEPRQAGLNGARVAYVVSRFPKITETFVLREALALEALGAEVHVFPLVAHAEHVVHAEAAQLEARVHRRSLAAPAVWWAVLATAVGAPRRTLRALRAAARGCGGSRAHLARAIATLPRAFWIARRLRALGIQHVHAHFANHPALAALVAHELGGVPYSFTAHGSDFHRDPRGLRAKVQGAAFAVTVSDYNRRFILEHAGADLAPRVEVLRCGVDLGTFEPRADEPAAPPLRIACVAALRQVKGHTHLLHACRALALDGIDFELELAGEGPRREALQEEARALGLEDRVRWLGPLTSDGVRALLARSHVGVLTSVQDGAGRREGVPVSLMEAMACGLPVVASRLSGIPELVEDGVSGLLAAPGDAAGIAAALGRLARDPELRRALGRGAREAVCTRYDLHENAAALAARIGRSFAPPHVEPRAEPVSARAPARDAAMRP